MNRYFSTFITGFHEVIPEILESRVPDVHVLSVKDGLIVYETSQNSNLIGELPFFNNSFVLLKEFGSKNMSLESMFQWALSKDDFWKAVKKETEKTQGTYRIIASDANEMVSDYKVYVRDIEKVLGSTTKLALNRSDPDHEIWFYSRQEGGGFIGLRITKHSDYSKTLQQGELRPELAYILNWLSDPVETDVFLDPFCGSGAIPLQRANHFPYERIIAGDKDTSKISRRILDLKMKNKKVEILELDAEALVNIEDDTIDKIVTDPPWGIFDDVRGLKSLYENFLNSSARVLTNRGMIVLLTAQRILITELISGSNSKFRKVGAYDILVSGKKASVYILRPERSARA